jgi:hypothetical protein
VDAEGSGRSQVDEIGGRDDRDPFLPRRVQVVMAVGALAVAASLGVVRVTDAGRSDPPTDRSEPTRSTAGPTRTPNPPAAVPGATHRSSRVGFIGLPPAGAAPSAPSGGELVVEVWTRPARAWLYADGRLITLHHGDRPEGANPVSTGLIERRLTPAGAERLRSYVARSATAFGPAPARPATAPTRPLVRVEGRLRVVTDPSPACDARSCGRVTNPGSWLPARMWQSRRPTAYVPSRFAVCYGLRASDDVADLDGAPAVPDASLFGRTAPADPRLPGDWPCSVVTTRRAGRIVEALRGARVLRDSAVGSRILAYVVDVRSPVPGSPPHEARLFFEPLLPDDRWPCSACG